MTQQEIGKAIKQRRKKLKVNQQTLADLSGVAVNTIVAIERGDGEYTLAPAYDLINTSLHLSVPRIFALDKGLFKEGMQHSDVRTVQRRRRQRP